MKHLFKPGDPFTLECARKGALASGFRTGDPRAQEAGRKGRQVSPWGQIPLNRNAIRTLRLEAIKRAAKRSHR